MCQKKYSSVNQCFKGTAKVKAGLDYEFRDLKMFGSVHDV